VPDYLTYLVRFMNPPTIPKGKPVKVKDVFEKFIIKIYTVDDQEYSITPDSQRKVFDSYLIYLILGGNISRLELVSTLPGVNDRYVLDTSEVHDNP